MRKQLNPLLTTTQNVRVEYARAAVNPDGSLAWSKPWKKNLVTDFGMNEIGRYRWSYLTRYLHLGNAVSPTPTRRAGGVVTFTLAGNALSSSAAFFEANDVGRLFQSDGGVRVYIVTVTNSQNVVVANESGAAFDAIGGTVWYVNKASLDAEFDVSGTRSEVAFVYDAPTATGYWEFTLESNAFTASRLVTELGWSSERNRGLFGRDLVPGGGDYVQKAQKYRITLRLYVTWPAGIKAIGNITTSDPSLNVAGQYCWRSIFRTPSPAYCLNAVQLGTTTQDPLLATPTSAAGYPTDWIYNAGKGLTEDAYTDGTFFFDRYATFDTNEGNVTFDTLIFSWIHPYDCPIPTAFFVHKLAAAQTKDSLHRLTVRLRMAWNRVLVN